MSENERKELSEKLHFGLALAERRMLEEKALRNECIYKSCLMEKLKVYLHVSCCVNFMEKN
mgnify:CR=1 FL=1